MTSAATTTETTQVNRVWIRATPQAIWDAITKREWGAATAMAAFPSTPRA